MARRNRHRWSDIAPGTDSPLAAAVAARDADTLAMVADAVRGGQVTLAYQPVMIAARNSPAFWEGLLRVFDPSGRVIPAADFIHAVETTRTGRDLDCLALGQGLAALALQPDLRLSVNMSARSIGYPPWMKTLKQGLGADPTIAERLILEITESSAMLVPEIVTTFMTNLQRRGISFALDDFGAGFTAFRYLRDFQFDLLKIDGQFIRGVADSADNQVLVRALVSIAEQFDMFTVAEAVERPEDAAWLRDNGLDCLQGYFFAAPTIHPPWAEAGRRTG